jgi:hypothetical protein
MHRFRYVGRCQLSLPCIGRARWTPKLTCCLFFSSSNVYASPRVGRSRKRSARTFLPRPSTRGATRPSFRRTTSARP